MQDKPTQTAPNPPGLRRAARPDGARPCNKCGRVLSPSAYPPDVNCADGRAGTCYDCKNAVRRARKSWKPAPLPTRIRKSLDKIRASTDQVAVYFDGRKRLCTAAGGTMLFDDVLAQGVRVERIVGVYDWRVRDLDFTADVHAVARAIGAPGLDDW